MKKLLLTGLAVASITVGGYLAASHYQDYQNKKGEPAKVYNQSEVDFKVNSVKSAAAAEYQALVVKYNGQVAECQKGQVAYDSLTAFGKSKVADPQCAPPVVQ